MLTLFFVFRDFGDFVLFQNLLKDRRCKYLYVFSKPFHNFAFVGDTQVEHERCNCNKAAPSFGYTLLW